MSRTHRERILDYLWSISPDYAANAQIREATGISSHQQVYLLTQELMYSVSSVASNAVVSGFSG